MEGAGDHPANSQGPGRSNNIIDASTQQQSTAREPLSEAPSNPNTRPNNVLHSTNTPAVTASPYDRQNQNTFPGSHHGYGVAGNHQITTTNNPAIDPRLQAHPSQIFYNYPGSQASFSLQQFVQGSQNQMSNRQPPQPQPQDDEQEKTADPYYAHDGQDKPGGYQSRVPQIDPNLDNYHSGFDVFQPNPNTANYAPYHAPYHSMAPPPYPVASEWNHGPGIFAASTPTPAGRLSSPDSTFRGSPLGQGEPSNGNEDTSSSNLYEDSESRPVKRQRLMSESGQDNESHHNDSTYPQTPEHGLLYLATNAAAHDEGNGGTYPMLQASNDYHANATASANATPSAVGKRATTRDPSINQDLPSEQDIPIPSKQGTPITTPLRKKKSDPDTRTLSDFPALPFPPNSLQNLSNAQAWNIATTTARILATDDLETVKRNSAHWIEALALTFNSPGPTTPQYSNPALFRGAVLQKFQAQQRNEHLATLKLLVPLPGEPPKANAAEACAAIVFWHCVGAHQAGFVRQCGGMRAEGALTCSQRLGGILLAMGNSATVRHDVARVKDLDELISNPDARARSKEGNCRNNNTRKPKGGVEGGGEDAEGLEEGSAKAIKMTKSRPVEEVGFDDGSIGTSGAGGLSGSAAPVVAGEGGGDLDDDDAA